MELPIFKREFPKSGMRISEKNLQSSGKHRRLAAAYQPQVIFDHLTESGSSMQKAEVLLKKELASSEQLGLHYANTELFPTQNSKYS